MNTLDNNSKTFEENDKNSKKTESETIEQWAEQVYEDIYKRKDELIELNGRNPLISKNKSQAKIEYKDKNCFSLINNSISESLDVFLHLSNKTSQQKRHFILPYENDKEFTSYQNKFKSIIKKQKEFFQEKGIRSLFISYGELVWKNQNNQKYTSPLFLCPIEIEKISDEHYRITFLEESFAFNHALMIALTKAIDEFEEDNKPDRFDSFKVQKKPNEFKEFLKEFKDELYKYKANISVEELKEDSITLMNLDYENIALYEHIANLSCQAINNNNILKDLFNSKDKKQRHSTSNYNKTELIDLEKKTYHFPTIEDADSSQLLAIQKVLEGKNLLIQGPPGTGKSQTIANIIASLLWDNKKVLFLTQKKAALDVVHHKLQQKDLDKFLLFIAHLKLKDFYSNLSARDLSEKINYTTSSSSNSEFEHIINKFLELDHCFDDNHEKTKIVLDQINHKLEKQFTSIREVIKYFVEHSEPFRIAGRDRFNNIDLSNVMIGEVNKKLNDVYAKYNERIVESMPVNSIHIFSEKAAKNLNYDYFSKLSKVLTENHSLLKNLNFGDLIQLIKFCKQYPNIGENSFWAEWNHKLEHLDYKSMPDLFRIIDEFIFKYPNLDLTHLLNTAPAEIDYLQKLKKQLLEIISDNLKPIAITLAQLNDLIKEVYQDIRPFQERVENKLSWLISGVSLNELKDEVTYIQTLYQSIQKLQDNPYLDYDSIGVYIVDKRQQEKYQQINDRFKRFKADKEILAFDNEFLSEFSQKFDSEIYGCLEKVETDGHIFPITQKQNLKEKLAKLLNLCQKWIDPNSIEHIQSFQNKLSDLLKESGEILNQVRKDYKLHDLSIENRNILEDLFQAFNNDHLFIMELIKNQRFYSFFNKHAQQYKNFYEQSKKYNFKQLFKENTNYDQLMELYTYFYNRANKYKNGSLVQKLSKLLSRKYKKNIQILNKYIYDPTEISTDNDATQCVKNLIDMRNKMDQIIQDYKHVNTNYYDFDYANITTNNTLAISFLGLKEHTSFEDIIKSLRNYLPSKLKSLLSSDQRDRVFNQIEKLNDNYDDLIYSDEKAQLENLLHSLDSLHKNYSDLIKLLKEQKLEYNYSRLKYLEQYINTINDLINEYYLDLDTKYLSAKQEASDIFEISKLDLSTFLETYDSFTNGFDQYAKCFKIEDSSISIKQFAETVNYKNNCILKANEYFNNSQIYAKKQNFNLNDTNQINNDLISLNAINNHSLIKHEGNEALKINEQISAFFKLYKQLDSNQFKEQFEGEFLAILKEYKLWPDCLKNKVNQKNNLEMALKVSACQELLELNDFINDSKSVKFISNQSYITNHTDTQTFIDLFQSLTDLNLDDKLKALYEYLNVLQKNNLTSVIRLHEGNILNHPVSGEDLSWLFLYQSLNEHFKNVYSKDHSDQLVDLISSIRGSNANKVKANLDKKGSCGKNQPRPPRVSDYTEDQLLTHMQNKSRVNSIKSFRDVFRRAPESMRNLYPCVLATPRDAVHYLNAEYKYDVMIIDEASQMRTIEAFPSMFYANQIVVVGDPKQMAPTNMFSSNIRHEGDESAFDDAESILDFVTNKVDQVPLLWHYRSLHENLIAFSNDRFYNNELIHFPSNNRYKDYGVHFCYVQDGRFTGGKNQIEAQKACQIANTLQERYHEESVGIIAMNAQHGDEIDKIISNRYPNAKVEVQNLENMQGHEADNIIISMTYNARESLRFGPINQEGGDKRLNVLFTRSKKRMIVVSSFKAEHIQGGVNQNIAIVRDFLNFAEKGEIRNSSNSGSLGNVESGFELAVKNFLENKNYKVTPQVGVGNYRIDLGVVDPNCSDRYLLAIECDGAPYHSSMMARERDYTRQQILENLGWKVYRIWSTNWFKAPNVEKKKLLDELKNLSEQSIDIKHEYGLIINDNSSQQNTFTEFQNKNEFDLETNKLDSGEIKQNIEKEENNNLKNELKQIKQKIVQEYPDTPEVNQLLNDKNFNLLLKYQPVNSSELAKVLNYRERQQINKNEAKYLPRIYELFEQGL